MFSFVELLVFELWYIVNFCEDFYGFYDMQGNLLSVDMGFVVVLEGDSIVSLNGYEKIVLRLKVGSYFDVKGRVDWRVDVCVLSGFLFFVVLVRNENVDGVEFDYCCNDFVVIFVLESLYYIF